MTVEMTTGTMVAMVMVTVDLITVSNGQCQKLDPVLWNEAFCPLPESYEWFSLKLKMNCGTDQHYHCASNSQGCFVQLCANRIFCESGHRPLLNPDNGTVICALCPPDRFQPVGVWSNEQSDCQYEKTKCNSNGQIECQPGSETTDRSCRCNISQNLALQYYALHNETCCTRNDVYCECIPFKSSCPNRTVRHENYKCLEECPPNSFRYWYSETCYPNSTTLMVEMVTNNPMNTSDHQMPLPGPKGSTGDGVVVGAVIAVLVPVGLIVGLCKYHRWKKKKKNRSRERTVNGNIDGYKAEEKANGHLVDVGDSNHQETSSVSEEDVTEKDLQTQSLGSRVESQNKVTLQNIFVFGKSSNISIDCGVKNTFNSRRDQRIKTQIPKNTGIESTSGRSSTIGENPNSQLNSCSHDTKPQQETRKEGTESPFTETESECRSVEHEEVVEMAELKFHIGDQSDSEETAVKLI